MKPVNKRIAAMSVICAVSVVIMLINVFGVNKAPVFTPPPFEDSAQAGEPSVPEGIGYQEVTTHSFRVFISGRVIQTGYFADVWLTNPQSNTAWLKLRIYDQQGKMIGETGIIKPGEFVQSVELNTKVSEGSEITLKIMAYEPNTYHSVGAISLHTLLE